MRACIIMEHQLPINPQTNSISVHGPVLVLNWSFSIVWRTPLFCNQNPHAKLDHHILIRTTAFLKVFKVCHRPFFTSSVTILKSLPLEIKGAGYQSVTLTTFKKQAAYTSFSWAELKSCFLWPHDKCGIYFCRVSPAQEQQRFWLVMVPTRSLLPKPLLKSLSSSSRWWEVFPSSYG